MAYGLPAYDPSPSYSGEGAGVRGRASSGVPSPGKRPICHPDVPEGSLADCTKTRDPSEYLRMTKGRVSAKQHPLTFRRSPIPLPAYTAEETGACIILYHPYTNEQYQIKSYY